MINVVLYEPEIPQNTGNIMRTCIATNSVLHLIEPLGFKLDEKHIKRSSVNYEIVQDVTYHVYKNWNDFLKKNHGEFYFLTRYGLKTMYDVKADNPNTNYYFILGKESTGIPKSILQQNLDRCIRLPMTTHVRALNVSNVAAIMVYEALRQQGFPNLSFVEPDNFKGSNWLLK